MTPDIFEHRQSLNQSTLLKNYRVWREGLTKIGGQETEVAVMPQSRPRLLDYWRQQQAGNAGFFISALAGDVYKIAPTGTNTRITRNNTSYVNSITGAALTNDTVWTSTQMYGGLTYIANNGQTTPQFVTTNAALSPGGLLQDIPGWIWNAPGDANPVIARTAEVVRVFDNQIWAANITDRRQNGTIEYLPNYIFYSDKATNPANTRGGYIPDVWQPSAGTTGTASNFAGYVTVNTSDPIIDMVPLRDTLLVFTTNNMYVVPRITTTQQAVTPQALSTVRGLLSNDCAVGFDGRVFAITTDDMIITTGGSLDFPSAINARFKDTFFNELLTKNPQWQANTFAVYNRFYQEIWVMFPSVASADGSCDQALVWHIDKNCWTQVDLPGIYSAVYAPVIGSNTGLRPWQNFNYAFNRLHYQNNTALLAQDIGSASAWTADNNIATVFEKVYDLEEQGGGADKVKSLAGIYLFAEGSVTLTVELKFSNTPFSDGVDWTTPDYSGDFVTLEDYKIDPVRNGRFIALRILSADQLPHQITSIDLDINEAGRRG